jgi:hypothetical protein
VKVIVCPARPGPEPAPHVDVVFIPEVAEPALDARPVRKLLGVAVPPRTTAFDRW